MYDCKQIIQDKIQLLYVKTNTRLPAKLAGNMEKNQNTVGIEKIQIYPQK